MKIGSELVESPGRGYTMRSMKILGALLAAACLLAGCRKKADEAEETEEVTAKQDGAGEEKADQKREGDKVEPVDPKDPTLGQAVMDSPEHKKASAANSKGLALLKKKKPDKAREKFEEALALAPDHAAAAYNLAAALCLANEPEAALEPLETAFKVNYPRFGARLDGDEDFQALKESPQLDKVEAMKKLYRDAWVRALASPGAFVLAARKSKVMDETGMVAFDEDLRRGSLFFFHLATERFLPLDDGRHAAGFVLDREGQRIHVVSWTRMTAETDIVPSQFAGLRIDSLGLADLSQWSVKVPKRATGIMLSAVGGRAELRYAWYFEPEATEQWVMSDLDASGLKKKGKAEAYPTPINLADDEWEADDGTCQKRKGEPVPAGPTLFLDVFCPSEFPQARAKWSEPAVTGCVHVDAETALCSRYEKGRGDALILRKKAGEEKIVGLADGIIQLDAL